MLIVKEHKSSLAHIFYVSENKLHHHCTRQIQLIQIKDKIKIQSIREYENVPTIILNHLSPPNKMLFV